MNEWFERDSFWEDFEVTLFGPAKWDRAPEQVDRILALTGAPDRCQVLDLCSGPGRHALEFARRGFSVTAVDRTTRYLDQGRQRADAEEVSVEWVEEDIRTFVRPESFDLAINLHTSFGYFEAAEDDRVVVRQMYRSLVHGGAVVIDVLGREALARVFSERHWARLDDDSLFLQESRVIEDWSRIESRWTLVRAGEVREHTFRLRLYSSTELRMLLTDAGFARVDFYGDLTGSPYDNTARRLIAVARK